MFCDSRRLNGLMCHLLMVVSTLSSAYSILRLRFPGRLLMPPVRPFQKLILCIAIPFLTMSRGVAPVWSKLIRLGCNKPTSFWLNRGRAQGVDLCLSHEDGFSKKLGIPPASQVLN